MSRPRIPKGRMPKGVASRQVILKCLRAVADGEFVQSTLQAHNQQIAQSNDQRLVREIVMGVLRHQTWLDRYIVPHIKGGIAQLDPPVLDALRLGVFQFKKLDRIPHHAAVSTTVEAYKRLYGRKAVGFVNGVLRSVLRAPDKDEKAPKTLRDLSVHYSQPMWLLERWNEALGFEETNELCDVLNQPAPLTVRPDRANSRDGLRDIFTEENASTENGRWTPHSLVLSHPDPFESKSFRNSLWTAQDEASQLVVELLATQPGDEIWDVCAAPGGKTALIDWLTQGEASILATDINPQKIETLKTRVFQGNVTCKVHDGKCVIENKRFDRVLLDAPCSATGVIRRHPEIKWRRTPDDVDAVTQTQRMLLDNVSQHVKIGGILVYSVCSPLRAEGVEQIKGFLERNPEFCLDMPKTDRVHWEDLWHKNGVTLWPHRHSTDAFFMTRLKRKAST